MIKQFGGGFDAVICKPGEVHRSLGIAFCLALDKEKKLLGWAVTGDYGPHVRHYSRIKLELPGYLLLEDSDGTEFCFTRELDDEYRKIWNEWVAYRGEENEPFPPEELTLEEAAEQMGYRIVPPDWLREMGKP
jgi:hypothetical protein